MGVAVEGEEDVADVDADTFVVVWGVAGVARERFLIAVEGKAYEFAAGIEHRGAGVASRDVAVVEKIHREIFWTDSRSFNSGFRSFVSGLFAF